LYGIWDVYSHKNMVFVWCIFDVSSDKRTNIETSKTVTFAK